MTIRRLFRLLFALALLAMGVRETLDPDMWWHLRTGALILSEGLPRQDPFSFTVAGQPWITHEWLSEVIMWLVYRAAGLAGLSLFFALVIALSFWLLYRSSAGQPYLAAFVVVLAALTAAPTWGARPQMFNLLLAAAFIWLLEGLTQKRLPSRARWWLPVLTLPWVNLHSGYLFGVVLVAVYALGQGLDTLLAGESAGADTAIRFGQADRAPSLASAALVTRLTAAWRSMRGLLLVAAVCLLAALANPNGVRLWTYPFATLGSAAMQQFIVEWHSPDFHLPLFQPFAVMMGVGVGSWLFSRQRPYWTEMLLFFGGAAMGLLSARNIPLFAVAVTPGIARHLLAGFRGRPLYPLLSGAQSEPVLPAALRSLNWLLAGLAVLAALFWAGQRLGNITTVISQLYPVAAVDFLEAQGLSRARGFNNYSWGGYLIWRGLPVYADGRADVYGDFLFTFQQTNAARDGWEEPLEAFDVHYALIERDAVLGTVLRESDRWQLVYQDDVAAVFLRDEVHAEGGE